MINYRIALLALIIPFALLGVSRRRRAETGEKLDRRQEGFFILIALRLSGIIFWLFVAGWMIRPQWMDATSVELRDPARLAGLGLLLVVMLWLQWVLRSLGANVTDTVVTRRVHELVKSGPYRWIRHPLYTGVLPLGIAFSLAMANWFPAAVSVLVFALLALRCRREEANLVARFGDAYRGYMRETGRFLPRLTA